MGPIMLLQDFFQKLALSPVGDLSVGGESTGTLPTQSYPRMVSHLNSALTDLHTRLPLRKEVLSIVALSSRNRYPLQRQHALTSGSAEPDKFIIDSASKPFLGDVLGIEAIHDADHCPLNLNVLGDRFGWHTVSFDTLTMGYPVTGETYFVQYRQRHPQILPNADPGATEIQIPPSLEAALVYYTGYCVFGAMTADSASMKANELMSLYERSLLQVTEANVTNTSITDVREERFHRDGWV